MEYSLVLYFRKLYLYTTFALSDTYVVKCPQTIKGWCRICLACYLWWPNKHVSCTTYEPLIYNRDWNVYFFHLPSSNSELIQSAITVQCELIICKLTLRLTLTKKLTVYACMFNLYYLTVNHYNCIPVYVLCTCLELKWIKSFNSF